MNVIIVDDEPLARRRIRRLLADYSDVTVLAECRNGEEAVRTIHQTTPDAIFLDVQMPGMDGFDVLRALRKDSVPEVVFVTAYDQYAIRAFEVNAIDYLLKPFDRDRFRKSVERARERIKRGRSALDQRKLLAMLEALTRESMHAQRFPIREGPRTRFVAAGDIEWIEATGNYVTFHTSDGKHLLRQTMKAIEAELDQEIFRRVHRQVIVNIHRIKELRSWGQGEYELTLFSGARVRVSRRYRHHLDQAL